MEHHVRPEAVDLLSDRQLEVQQVIGSFKVVLHCPNA